MNGRVAAAVVLLTWLTQPVNFGWSAKASADPSTSSGSAPSAAERAERQVAVTFDDLPVVGVALDDEATNRAVTTRLLDAVSAHNVPTIGFVIGRKVSEAPWQAALLRLWLDRGHELGNHTFSHDDFHAMPASRWRDEVLRADAVLAPILAERHLKPRFFRHPMLHTGRSVEDRSQFDDFLAERGYRVAPVTIDNDDYIFARAYDHAAERDDRRAMREIAGAFLPYMEAKFAFFERNSSDMFGRQIPQILLLHVNRLNADTFGDLASMIERRGYRFISIESALTDAAYRSKDTYVGPAGMTWLHRWALTAGKPKAFYQNEPDVPAFVAQAAAVGRQ